jgi:hypothetical protein
VPKSTTSEPNTAKHITKNGHDARHNPEKALDLIKAAHRAGGHPADAQLIENARNGWVQCFKGNEVVVTRNGKTGFRGIGVNNGPLRNSSYLERRLQQQETEFLKQIGRLESLDAAILRLASHRQKACFKAAAKRGARASQVETLILDSYQASTLPPHNRAGAIAMTLNSQGFKLSVRRVRQILRANISAHTNKNGNDRD